MTTTEKFKNFKPSLVRLLAREKGGKPLSSRMIGSGVLMDPLMVDYISEQNDWSVVRTNHAFNFLVGCGLGIDDHKAWRRVTDYLSKRPSFQYLRESPDWKTIHLPLMTKWRVSYGQVEPTSSIWPPLRELLIRMNPLLTPWQMRTEIIDFDGKQV